MTWAARYSATEEPEITVYRDGVEWDHATLREVAAGIAGRACRCGHSGPWLSWRMEAHHDTQLRADIAARVPVRECEETQACTRHAMPDGALPRARREGRAVMGYAKPTQARLIDQRARRRAAQDLIEAHREEFDRLYWQHRHAAGEEADALAAKAAENHDGDDHHADEPPRIKPGVRKEGETPLDRLDVARCPHCIRHHDRGHVCKSCGAVPTHALTIPDDGDLDEIAIERAMRGDTVRLTVSERAEAARRMAANGATQAQILNALRMSKRRLDQILGSAS